VPFTSPINSPPLGSHEPGELIAHFASIEPRANDAAPKSKQLSDATGISLNNGIGAPAQVVSWYAENETTHCASTGSPHWQGVQSTSPFVPE
jgi:hypothetical protein